MVLDETTEEGRLFPIVRPQLEYAAAVWDPHTKGKTKQVEKVQRRAARCVSDTMNGWQVFQT